MTTEPEGVKPSMDRILRHLHVRPHPSQGASRPHFLISRLSLSKNFTHILNANNFFNQEARWRLKQELVFERSPFRILTRTQSILLEVSRGLFQSLRKNSGIWPCSVTSSFLGQNIFLRIF